MVIFIINLVLIIIMPSYDVVTTYLTILMQNGNISKATHAALERRMACNLPNRRLTDMSGAATECTITASKVASRVAHAAKQVTTPLVSYRHSLNQFFFNLLCLFRPSNLGNLSNLWLCMD